MNVLLAESDSHVGSDIRRNFRWISREHQGMEFCVFTVEPSETLHFLERRKSDMLVIDISEQKGREIAAQAILDHNIPVLGLFLNKPGATVMESDLLRVIVTPEFDLRAFRSAVFEFYERYEDLACSLQNSLRHIRHLTALERN